MRTKTTTLSAAARARRSVGPALLAVLVLAAAPIPARASDDPDPWAGLNRPIFRFNDALDRAVLEPVARGYRIVMPDACERGVTNFFTNLWFPVVFANTVLQAKPREATQSLARFIVNTTAGVGGLWDPATRLGIPSPNEDFGQTLGAWGVPPGPYLVIPLLGPSNVRDTGGRVVDSATRTWPWLVPWWVSTAAGPLEVVSTRARYLEEIDDLKESSVDFYASVRNAYLQRRQALVEDRVGTTGEKRHLENEDDLYFPESVVEAPR